MDVLDKFLGLYIKTPVISKSEKTCCDDEYNVIYNEEWFVCSECGKVISTHKEENDYKQHISFINKTYIPMSYKNSKLVRIQRWLNYSYYEVRNDKLTKFIDTLDIPNRQVKHASKVIFLEEFNKVRIRAKVKMGLVCYAIYKSHLIFNHSIDIDNLFNMLDITEKHYNTAVKKLSTDRLFYPKNIDKYLTLIDYKIEKNNLIRSYNDFLDNETGFNSKTILLSLIYYYLKEKKLLKHYQFYRLYKISTSSINSVMKLIKKEYIY